jgi:LacI family transcriptional regulator
MKKTTIREVAERAGVSVSTVSRFLNNRPDINAETKERIQKAIDELKYVPSSIARGMVLNKTNTIGLILPDITNPYFSSIARGIQHTADQYGYSVILCDTESNPGKELNSIKLLRSKRVSGMIAALSGDCKDELLHLKSENFPFVQIDRNIPGVEVPTVTADNLLSAKTAVNYLIEAGHREIAHLAGDLSTKTARNRFQGFEEAMKESGLSINREWVLECEFSIASGIEKMSCILEGNQIPTAVFCGNDLIATGAYQVIKTAGLKIPEDISIVGHDDIELASIITPALTTMALDKYSMGQLAVEALIREIEDGVTTNNEIILGTSLIIRESVQNRYK